MRDPYPWEKFYSASCTLAATADTIQQRVANAFSYNLHLLIDGPGGNSPSLPEETKQKLIGYQNAWRATTDPDGRGTIVVWAGQLSDEEAMDIAEWILETAFDLDRALAKDD